MSTDNARYGDTAGDLMLRQIGAFLRKRIGTTDDIAFRSGGEELELTHEGSAPHGRVAVSIGVGTFRGPRVANDVFGHVDAALYRIKGGGRNRIERVGALAG